MNSNLLLLQAAISLVKPVMNIKEGRKGRKSISLLINEDLKLRSSSKVVKLCVYFIRCLSFELLTSSSAGRLLNPPVAVP